MFFKRSELKMEKGNISNQILTWGFSREKYLNITSPPYNSSEIFIDVILDFVYRNYKVLYVTEENNLHIELVEKIKRRSKFRGYTYLKEKSSFKDSLLIIAKHGMLERLEEKFDLVIYDDIKGFSDRSKYEIIESITSKAKNNAKIIVYSIEKTFENKKEILFPVRDNGYPIIEPKFISTRVDINKDIPYVAYEYIEWSLKTNQKVIVYAPDESKVRNIYQYLCLYCSKLEGDVVTFVKDRSDKKVLDDFIRSKQGLLITNDFYFDIKNANVMVFFADDKLFCYKKLVYLSGKVGRSVKNRRGEVIFLGNFETEAIDKAKNITRHFNKEAWEMNLLKL